MSTITPQPNIGYQDFLHDIKTQVTQSRIGAVRAVNRSLIELYWSLGKMIVERQEELGWGHAVVDQLSTDLRIEFPDMTGFSPRNLWDIKRFYETYANAPEFLRQLVAEIPWGQTISYNHAACGNESKNLAVKVEAHLAKMGFNL